LETDALDLTDTRRLAALRRVALLDTPAEEAFDRLTRLAGLILGVPIALVSLVDADRQFFKSCIGLPEPLASLRETPLSHSFCQHTVASRLPLVIEDAREHTLVRDNPAIPDLDVIAYAGIPLITSDGHVLGSFCAIDHRPRPWSAHDLEILAELAGSAMSIIELRAASLLLEAARDDRERLGARLEATEARERAAHQRRIDDLLDVSVRLQRGLLPTRQRAPQAIRTSSFYRPGARTLLLGGDFFDVMDHGADLHFILADVAGHGPEAAAFAVALRAAWAALQQQVLPPLLAIEHLNRIALLEQQDEAMFVTAVAGAYFAETRSLELVSAGHPAPLLLSAAEVAPLALPPGPPLGIFDDAAWTAATVPLPDGAAVMAYTDGLVEGRVAPGAMERLGTEAVAAHARAIIARDGIADDLPRTLHDLAAHAHGGPLEDDVAILLIHPN
jgi:serine phosphatase RsbU (regulator of sigma subunit)